MDKAGSSQAPEALVESLEEKAAVAYQRLPGHRPVISRSSMGRAVLSALAGGMRSSPSTVVMPYQSSLSLRHPGLMEANPSRVRWAPFSRSGWFRSSLPSWATAAITMPATARGRRPSNCSVMAEGVISRPCHNTRKKRTAGTGFDRFLTWIHL